MQARLSFSLIRASASSLLVSSSSFVLINDDWLVVQCRVHTRGWKLQWCMVEVLYDGGILSTNLLYRGWGRADHSGSSRNRDNDRCY